MQRADTDFKAGAYDSARIEYMNVLRSDPQNEFAITQLGNIWFEDGAPIRALPFLRKATEFAPKNLDARTKLAMTLISLGDLSNARKQAVTILDQDPGNDEAIMLLADTARTPREVDETILRLQTFNASQKPSGCLASATLATRKGDLKAAEDAIQRAIALDAKLPSAHLAKAELLSLKGEPDQAVNEFKAAAELAPIRSTARLKYAEFETATGARAQAVAILQNVAHEAPDYLPAWGALAKIAGAEKKYDESLGLLENIFNRDPLNLEGRLLQSDIMLAKGEVKSALDLLDRLNRFYPQVPLARYQLARAYMQNDSAIQAIAALNQALTLNSDYLDALLLLAEAELRAGDAEPVLVSMKRVLEEHPNLIQARALLAAAYRSLGQLDDAIGTLHDEIGASPGSARPHVDLGLILRQQRKLIDARNEFEKAQELEPDNPAPVEQLVELDLLAKDFKAAFERVQRQSQRGLRPAATDFLEAKIYVAQGQWDQAEAALLKTLQLDPGHSPAYDLLIFTYVAANRLADASSHLNSLLSKQPNNVSLLMLSGLIYEKTDQFSNARDAYEKLLSESPDFPPALNNLAWLYAENLNQLDKAYGLARKARALQPDAAATADTLGWILYKQADYGQAVTLLQESAAKLPNNPQVQLHLGMALYMMGELEAARASLARAVTDPSEFPGKQDAQRRLAVLGNGSGDSRPPSIEELERLLKQQPDDVVARLLLGGAYERLGKFANAAETYDEAVKINRQLLPAYVRLAKLYAGPLGDKKKANEFATKVRELEPGDSQDGSNPSSGS